MAVVEGQDEFDCAVAAHDARLHALGLHIWVGNEPTFTDRRSDAAEWASAALGPEKRARADQILRRLAGEQPGCAVLRSIGRQYPGEVTPRWSLGLYARRDGAPVWSGPADPLLAPPASATDVNAFHGQLSATLARRGHPHRAFATHGDRRIIFACDPAVALPDPDYDGRLLRASIHVARVPPDGLRDELASDGFSLLIVSDLEEAGATVPCVELPALDDVRLLLHLLGSISEAAQSCGLRSLVLRGFAPPVDASVRWTTVTPDPAVVEINMAPHGSVRAFLEDNRRCYEAAAVAGLDPYRLHYNGTVADSGGGGQITLGGPSVARSPFFLEPLLLPRLIRYAGSHPALSYLFAHDYVGASGQSVRPDEHGVDALGELNLALTLLDGSAPADPVTLWSSLAPSLTDPVGNSHRAEINVEKLWNPHQPGRGQQGLVEFRAFRMQHTPEHAAALAALLRSVLAMLIVRDERGEFVDWGARLHDRFALPFYLEADLREVLGDLDAAGVGLSRALRVELETNRCRRWAAIEFGDCILTIRRALEFWPLVGDASSQHGTSRLVDASTSRIELTLRSGMTKAAAGMDGWVLRADDFELPMRAEIDSQGAVLVFGIRYRAFVPTRGLHPTLGAQAPVRLTLMHPARAEALEIVLHEWRPDGAPYEGVPADLAEAAARRAARCVLRRVPITQVRPVRDLPRAALRECSLDLRYASAPRGNPG